jgi:beta-lactam-binding protein with PASTA domain
VPDNSITVPNVAGQTFDSADSTLQQMGLFTARQDIFDAEVPEGRVIRTDPEPGTIVNENSDESERRIDVYVSLGKQTASVPEVTGRTVADATAALTSLGLEVGTTTKENSPTVPADTVIRTDPAAGTASYVGDSINLVVSSGLVSVPDVTGQALNEASTTLQSLALQVSVDGDPGCKTVAGNPVSSQSVAAGDAPQKSAIVIRYCTGT